MNEVRLVENYGPLTRGVSYSVIKSGYDWILVKHNGKSIMVPRNMIDYKSDEDFDDIS